MIPWALGLVFVRSVDIVTSLIIVHAARMGAFAKSTSTRLRGFSCMLNNFVHALE